VGLLGRSEEASDGFTTLSLYLRGRRGGVMGLPLVASARGSIAYVIRVWGRPGYYH
jgi:hypothetical protein